MAQQTCEDHRPSDGRRLSLKRTRFVALLVVGVLAVSACDAQTAGESQRSAFPAKASPTIAASSTPTPSVTHIPSAHSTPLPAAPVPSALASVQPIAQVPASKPAPKATTAPKAPVAKSSTASKAPVSKSSTAPKAAAKGSYYKNCTEARAAGVTPILRGQPGYRPALDRDKDGIACE